MLDRAVAALSDEAVVVGSGWGVGGEGIPELFAFVYVLNVVNEVSPAVVDEESVVWVSVVFEQVGDDENVVCAVVVGGYEVGELELAWEDFDRIEEGVGAGDEVACEPRVYLRKDKPYLVFGGQGGLGNIPMIGGVSVATGVEVVGLHGLFFE